MDVQKQNEQGLSKSAIARAKTGNGMDARITMMAKTTKSSICVKPL